MHPAPDARACLVLQAPQAYSCCPAARAHSQVQSCPGAPPQILPICTLAKQASPQALAGSLWHFGSKLKAHAPGCMRQPCIKLCMRQQGSCVSAFWLGRPLARLLPGMIEAAGAFTMSMEAVISDMHA